MVGLLTQVIEKGLLVAKYFRTYIMMMRTLKLVSFMSKK